MIKIIMNKKYDTDTATKVGEYYSSECLTDFNYYEETLYRKRNGEFFTYGFGGPLTKYAKHCGNETFSGAKIIPLSIEEAKEWVELYLEGEKYIEIFGDVEE